MGPSYYHTGACGPHRGHGVHTGACGPHRGHGVHTGACGPHRGHVVHILLEDSTIGHCLIVNPQSPVKIIEIDKVLYSK